MRLSSTKMGPTTPCQRVNAPLRLRVCDICSFAPSKDELVLLSALVSGVWLAKMRIRHSLEFFASANDEESFVSALWEDASVKRQQR